MTSPRFTYLEGDMLLLVDVYLQQTNVDINGLVTCGLFVCNKLSVCDYVTVLAVRFICCASRDEV
ncbi:hypothetical protein MtrunA17_Chr1g0190841 [Medicago truncatula]|uniref:Uncharacterized protein n=1 Tax=Medicago truncatula TaxID=3880 RepID=A0A396JWF6_MEDTR|nr:hypothetical protein MtrunA17_Chr1g0190841 [Medicago truncatula]